MAGFLCPAMIGQRPRLAKQPPAVRGRHCRYHDAVAIPNHGAAMAEPSLAFDTDAAVARLLRYLAVEGVTGEERAIGEAVVEDLLAAGVPRRAIRFDRAHEQVPLPTQTGNLIVTLPGT